MSFETAISQEQGARIDLIRRTRIAYQGHDVGAPVADQVLGLPTINPDERTSNWVQRIIDRNSGLLLGNPIEIAIDGAYDSPSAVWFHETYPDEEFYSELYSGRTLAGQTGDTIWKLIPADGDDPPRFILKDPATVKIYGYDKSDVKDESFFDDITEDQMLVKGEVKACLMRQLIWRDPPKMPGGRKWHIQDGHSLDKGETWSKDAEQIDWIYKTPPIIHYQDRPNPGSVYGRPDLDEAGLRGAKSLNAGGTHINALVRKFANNRPYTTGLTPAQRLEFRKEVLKGGVIHMPAGTTYQVAELKADLAGALSAHQDAKTEWHETTGMPEMASEKMKFGAQSAVALEMLHVVAIDDLKLRRHTTGAGVKNLIQGLCELGGQGNAVTVSLKWRYPLPQDGLAVRQSMAMDVEVFGASRTTQLDNLDYDIDDERERREEEDALTQASQQDAMGAMPGAAPGAAPGGAPIYTTATQMPPVPPSPMDEKAPTER